MHYHLDLLVSHTKFGKRCSSLGHASPCLLGHCTSLKLKILSWPLRLCNAQCQVDPTMHCVTLGLKPSLLATGQSLDFGCITSCWDFVAPPTNLPPLTSRILQSSSSVHYFIAWSCFVSWFSETIFCPPRVIFLPQVLHVLTSSLHQSLLLWHPRELLLRISHRVAPRRKLRVH